MFSTWMEIYLSVLAGICTLTYVLDVITDIAFAYKNISDDEDDSDDSDEMPDNIKRLYM